MHWARIALTAPGIELYITPPDSALVSDGYQYRLRHLRPTARAERLAIAVNGPLFKSEPSWVPGYRPGQRANSLETVVADRAVSHIWVHTYLLWFGSDLAPTLERRKPPPPAAIAQARWAIGGQGIGLADGRVTEGLGRETAARTAVGIDPARRLLFLAVFESASPHAAMEQLAMLGATDGLLLDGGGSSAMVIGAGAAGVEPGTVLGGWRPVATHFGVRARPCGE